MRNVFETVIDIGSGLILSILIQLLIFPWFDLRPTIIDSIGIALIFTAVSMVRSLFWRTIFTKLRND